LSIKRLWKPILLTVIFIIAIISVVGYFQFRMEIPGELVEVDGYTMHMRCTGEGSPTVILEAGWGDWSLQWQPLQEEISTFTRVCSYDRSGTGFSDIRPEGRTVQQMSDELATLLETANIEAPYILVGHSFGGMIVRLYASQYPENIAGIVLLDSVHPDFYSDTINAKFPELAEGQDSVVSQFEETAEMLSNAPIPRNLAPLFIPDSDVAYFLPEELRKDWKQQVMIPEYFQSMVGSINVLDESVEQVTGTNLQDIPLTVIAAGKSYLATAIIRPQNELAPNYAIAEENIEEYTSVWLDFQEDLANLSTNSTLIIAEESGHYIHYDQPELVLNAIRQLVEALP
jgi:pimeloyl-ACP methyl ester carboxylesterase